MSIAQHLALTIELLDELSDVDRPEDVAVAESALARKPFHCEPDTISVIIPTYNEVTHIEATLAGLKSDDRGKVSVADGGSSDGTAQKAAAQGVRILIVSLGRARQMNAAAREANGDILIFLHADTRLPDRFADAVRKALTERGVVAGAFEFRVDVPTPGLRFVEKLTNRRSRRLKMPHVDQGLFLKASTFHDMGGFRDMPIMEDFDLVRKLKRQGRVVTLPLPALTSGRRWKQLGVFRTTLINQIVIAGYYIGIPTESLARLYRRAEGIRQEHVVEGGSSKKGRCPEVFEDGNLILVVDHALRS